MTSQARAIVWAQWRIWANYYPKSNRVGSALGALLAALWYGLWLLFAIAIFRIFSEPSAVALTHSVLPAGLLFVFVYWQLVPVLLASTGVGLELKKLQVYPIPHAHLFLIDLLLRITSSFEMFLVMGGLAAGIVSNPVLPFWSALGIVPFIVFNLAIAAGTREIVIRIMARKRIREIAVLLLVSIGAIPQLLVITGAWEHISAWFRTPAQPFWPWSATALIAGGQPRGDAVLSLLAWTALAYWFGRRQFERSLHFDAAEANATPTSSEARRRRDLWSRMARWPGLLFKDPLASLIEKEIRFLARAPRFRLVFLMGFTFGLVIWLPITLGRGAPDSFFARNYLTMVSLYAILLLGDVCFWNIFGFDRSAAQAYWVMPVDFRTVLAGKNITAAFFVALEITIIVVICTLIGTPTSPVRALEAYAAAAVMTLYLVALGNLTSVMAPRATNPSKAMRSGSAGRMQATLFLLYPAAALPIMLAFAGRYAFRTDAAFFAVLLICALIGAAVYWVALDSAIETANRNREQILAALSQGEGIIQG